jgi:SnoaL-like polyketide cyclase
MSIRKFAGKCIMAENEAWQKGNFDPLKALEDPNMVVHMPLGTPDMVGHEAHKQQIINARKYWSDIKQEWKYLTGDGNLFVMSYKSSFKVTGINPEAKYFTVGKKVSSDEIIALLVKKGRIVEIWANGSFKITD